MSLTYGVSPAIIEQIEEGPRYWWPGLAYVGQSVIPVPRMTVHLSEFWAKMYRDGVQELYPGWFKKATENPIPVTKNQAIVLARQLGFTEVRVVADNGAIVETWEVTS